MDDWVVRLHCIQELDFLPQVDAEHIGVTVLEGVVTLTGPVAAYAGKHAAEQTVLQGLGARAIVQRIEVRNDDGPRIDDEELATRCARVIAWDGTVPDGSVVVKVEKGHVTLAGWVDRYDQKAAAETALRRLAGITDIVNVVGLKRAVSDRSEPVRDKPWAALY